MASQAPQLGIRKIDLGYGDHDFKHKIADTVTEVPFGLVTSSRLRFHAELVSSRAQQWVRSLPGKQKIKRMIRWVSPSIDRHFLSSLGHQNMYQAERESLRHLALAAEMYSREVHSLELNVHDLRSLDR